MVCSPANYFSSNWHHSSVPYHGLPHLLAAVKGRFIFVMSSTIIISACIISSIDSSKVFFSLIAHKKVCDWLHRLLSGTCITMLFTLNTVVETVSRSHNGILKCHNGMGCSMLVYFTLKAWQAIILFFSVEELIRFLLLPAESQSVSYAIFFSAKRAHVLKLLCAVTTQMFVIK